MAKAINPYGLISSSAKEDRQHEHIVLPDGTYEFTVGQREVGNYEPSPGAKLPACEWVGYPLHTRTDNGEVVLWYRLYLVKERAWKALQFFQSVGLMLDKCTADMPNFDNGGIDDIDWSAPTGRTGRCKIGHHDYDGKTYNDVVECIPVNGETYDNGPKAKKTLYHGIKYDSSIEAKTAEALDNLGIGFQHTRVGTRGKQYIGGQCTPDFYLPNMNIYLEVAQFWDKRHHDNAGKFIRETGCFSWNTYYAPTKEIPRYIAIDGNGGMHAVDSNGDTGFGEPANIYLARCNQCGEFFFVHEREFWGCPYCAYHENRIPNGNSNIFSAGGIAINKKGPNDYVYRE